MTVLCKTICVECKWHCGAVPEAVWYDHRCQNPGLKRIQEQDPVTGLIGFTGVNSLGQPYQTDAEFPYCRDINKGNCERFEGVTA